MAQMTPLNGLTMNLVNPAFVLGSTNTLTTTVTSAGAINGKFVTPVTALTNSATTPTSDAATGAAFAAMAPNKATVLVIGQDAAGAALMCQGSVVDTYVGVTTTVGAFKDAPQFPVLPDGMLPWAYFLVRTAPSAAAWTAGTSSWTASGVSCTAPQNVVQLPNRPAIA